MKKTECPNCGKSKKAWFKLCFECTNKEKNTPICEVCETEVPEGHTLCKKHWKEQQKPTSKTTVPKPKKNIPFQEVYEAPFYFDSYKVRSKSELLICYFLAANGINFQYERLLTLEKEIRPDFIIDDLKGNFIILEHFGMNTPEYLKKRKQKEKEYKKLCDAHNQFHFVSTDEDDILNLKDNLGKKLNATPLSKPFWR